MTNSKGQSMLSVVIGTSILCLIAAPITYWFLSLNSQISGLQGRMQQQALAYNKWYTIMGNDYQDIVDKFENTSDTETTSDRQFKIITSYKTQSKLDNSTKCLIGTTPSDDDKRCLPITITVQSTNGTLKDYSMDIIRSAPATNPYTKFTTLANLPIMIEIISPQTEHWSDIWKGEGTGRGRVNTYGSPPQYYFGAVIPADGYVIGGVSGLTLMPESYFRMWDARTGAFAQYEFNNYPERYNQFSAIQNGAGNVAVRNWINSHKFPNDWNPPTLIENNTNSTSYYPVKKGQIVGSWSMSYFDGAFYVRK